jgi:putative transposase
MPHTHVSNRLHCIFSTKNREPMIPKEIQSRLWAYMEGICRNIGVKTFAIGGMEEHVHLLIGLSPTLALATAMQRIKANSSRYMNEHGGPRFQWQENYSAFSVSISHMDATIAYIQNQEKHHRRCSFADELATILKKHGMEE